MWSIALRNYRKNEEQARGLAIFDKSEMESQYQNCSKIYQTMGNQWKEKLNNFSEVPLFLDSKMSRSIQIADLIAFSLPLSWNTQRSEVSISNTEHITSKSIYSKSCAIGSDG